MTPDSSGADWRLSTELGGRHRASKKKTSIIVRTIGVGAAAGCIALVAEMNAPNAEALSILLPAGNGNVTEINILEGNIFQPQFGLGGNGNNVSNNRTIGSIIFGGKDVTGKSHSFGTIDLSGGNGTGNVTQVNILSYNIINPQASIFGSNFSQNTTISNVAVGNGNGAPTTATATGGIGLIGPATGAGNTTQISLLSSNIFNPQLSLFGSNTSYNTAVTNVSGINGNGSPTATTGTGIFGTAFSPITGAGNTTQVAGGSGNVINPQYSLLGSNTSNNLAITNVSFLNGNFSPTDTEGGALGAFLVGITGSGNSTQFAGLVSNILNPQGTFGGYNSSDNEAWSNSAFLNGNFSSTDVTSPGGGNNTILGQIGSGNANQFGNGNGTILNNQYRLFTGLTQPQQSTGNAVQQVTTTTSQTTPPPPEQETPDVSEFTNAQLASGEQGSGTGTGTGSGAGSGTGSALLTNSTGQPGSTGGLSTVAKSITDTVKNAADAVKKALTPNKSTAGSAGTGGS